MTALYRHTSTSGSQAIVELDPSRRGDEVSPLLYGKFGEHLYSPRGVKNALEAQTLFNPTFGSWKFQDPQFGEDGGRGAIHDPDEIDERIEQYVDHHRVPAAKRLQSAYHDGFALWWFPYGEETAVRASPDTGTAADRAQRFELVESVDRPSGLAQWCHLPVHRTRSFEARATIRAREPTDLRFAVHEVGEGGTLGNPIAETTVTARAEFHTVEFDLELPETIEAGPGSPFGFSVTTRDESANVVVDRVCCYPDDHVARADPEIVDLLAEMELPVLRWPGGNFVSGYHWEDGVGPIEGRPTRPNPAWDAIETNLFGTHEFVAFCEAVGCEPMICLNAGNGSPKEAAKWVEYCNGSTDTEMGALRAEHGHPEPYDVAYWEVGNEVYGNWQIGWTTNGGYADRYRRFKDAMTAVDDSIEVFACGNRLTDWNDPLLDEIDVDDWLTDHVLIECHADPGTDPVELFNAHSAVAGRLGDQYREVAEDCREAGVEGVRQAITELQLFTRFDEDEEYEGERLLDADALPTNKSITEVVFDTTIIHECIRTGSVDMVTHSGVGNHGGGVRKLEERVWADPCYYGLQLGTALVGGTPIGVDVTCDTFSTETAFGTDTAEWFGELPTVTDAPAVDVMAVTDADAHDLAVILVHCDAGSEEIDVTVEAGEFLAGVDEVRVDRLTADTMYEQNTFEDPERVSPTTGSAPVDEDGCVTVSLPTYSLVRITADGVARAGSADKSST